MQLDNAEICDRQDHNRSHVVRRALRYAAAGPSRSPVMLQAATAVAVCWSYSMPVDQQQLAIWQQYIVLVRRFTAQRQHLLHQHHELLVICVPAKLGGFQKQPLLSGATELTCQLQHVLLGTWLHTVA